VDVAENSSKSSIERAAAEEFRLFGFHGARIDRIARRSGLNKQLIYYYFGSKRKLYHHTLENAARQLHVGARERRSLPDSPSDRLRVLLSHAIERAVATPDILRATVLDPENSTARRSLQDLAAEFAREISRGQGLGHYRDDVDPGVAGRQAALLVLGWVLTAPVFDEDTSDYGEWAHSVAGVLGRALSW
jgi:TetR/AcrR family transcriptional regulator